MYLGRVIEYGPTSFAYGANGEVATKMDGAGTTSYAHRFRSLLILRLRRTGQT